MRATPRRAARRGSPPFAARIPAGPVAPARTSTYEVGAAPPDCGVACVRGVREGDPWHAGASGGRLRRDARADDRDRGRCEPQFAAAQGEDNGRELICGIAVERNDCEPGARQAFGERRHHRNEDDRRAIAARRADIDPKRRRELNARQARRSQLASSDPFRGKQSYLDPQAVVDGPPPPPPPPPPTRPPPPQHHPPPPPPPPPRPPPPPHT